MQPFFSFLHVVTNDNLLESLGAALDLGFNNKWQQVCRAEASALVLAAGLAGLTRSNLGLTRCWLSGFPVWRWREKCR